MKIDREHFESAVSFATHGKLYKFHRICDTIGKYEVEGGTSEFFFETDTDERIGVIFEADVRASRRTYYTAKCVYGWDGSKKSKKDMVKTLCTRADYWTAYGLLMEEYKSRKN